MNTYNLYVDELVQVWKRIHINIKANSEKDAIDKYLNEEDYDDIISEYLYESEENANPIIGPSIEILTFYSMQNITKDDYKKGYTYLDFMKKNVEALRLALN